MMKVKLLKNARINHKAGEIVEVSPTEYAFLTSLGSAVDAVAEEPKIEIPEEEKPKKVTVRKKK
ncbi:MAG: hypothetical protein IIY21_24230 [Clostridiales bacterium]|jgi:hypothetical protein|nr:hypothetical protein [Clostridiales bacterium]